MGKSIKKSEACSSRQTTKAHRKGGNKQKAKYSSSSGEVSRSLKHVRERRSALQTTSPRASSSDNIGDLEIENLFNSKTISGFLSVNNSDTPNAKTLAILLHGAGGGMNSANMVGYSQLLFSLGLSVFRYTAKGNLEGRIRALKSVLAYFGGSNSSLEPEKTLLLGHSMGSRVIGEVVASFSPLASPMSHEKMDVTLPDMTVMINQIIGLIFLSYPIHPDGKGGTIRDMGVFSRISLPTLFVIGTKDRMVSRQVLESRLKDQQAIDWNIREVEGQGHSLLMKSSNIIDDACQTYVTEFVLDKLGK